MAGDPTADPPVPPFRILRPKKLKFSEGSVGAGHWAVGGGDLAGALKRGTRGDSCALIATVHGPGSVLPRSRRQPITG